MAVYLGIVDSGVTLRHLRSLVVQQRKRLTTQVADKMGSMSLEPSKTLRSGALAPMGGEGTSGIVEALDPQHCQRPKEASHRKEREMYTRGDKDRAVRCSRPAAKGLTASLAVMAMSAMITSGVAAAPEDEVRAVFDRFVAAQNAHDIKAVESLLLGSSEFLWVTRGTAVWGQDAAIKRFASLYQGTWRLEPDASNLKIVFLGSGVAQVHVPIMFTIGVAGQSPQQTRFLMNQLFVNTPNGWRVSSILPIPAPAQ